MEMNNKIDDLFARKAKDFTASTPTGSWNRISASLARKRRRKLLIWWFSASIALITIIGGIWFNYEDYLHKNDGGKKPISSSNTFKSNKSVVNSTSNDSALDKVNHHKNSDSNGNGSTYDYSKAKNVVNPATNHRFNEKQANDLVDKSIEGNLMVASLKVGAIDQKEIFESTTIDGIEVEATSPLPELVINDSNESISTTAPEVVNPIVKNAARTLCFYLTLNMGSENNFRFGEEQLNKATAYSTNERRIKAFTLGADLSVVINRKLEFGFGFQRHNLGFQGDFKLSNPDIRFVNVQDFGITSLGLYSIINIENVLITNHFANSSYLSKFNVVKVSVNTIDLGLRAAYVFKYRNFDFKLGAGLNTAIITSNQVKAGQSKADTYLGYIEGLKSNVLGGNINFNLGYNLTENLSFGIQGHYLSYFSSLNTSPDYSYIPYSYAILPYLRFKLVAY